jgi:hypothetical protein
MANVGEMAPASHDALVSGEERALVLKHDFCFSSVIFPTYV